MTTPEKHTRYNRSPKGRARYDRYRATPKGQANKRIQTGRQRAGERTVAIERRLKELSG